MSISAHSMSRMHGTVSPALAGRTAQRASSPRKLPVAAIGAPEPNQWGNQPAIETPDMRARNSASAETPSGVERRGPRVCKGLGSSGSNPLDSHVKEVLYTHDQIQLRVCEIADQVSEDLRGRDDVVMVGVLTGAFMFTSDLLKHLTIPAEVKFIKASSYGDATESCGDVTMSLDDTGSTASDFSGKTVVLVEDIIDTGTTLSHLVSYIRSLRPRDVKIVCLLDKPSRRVVDVKVDYTAFSIPDEFVIGYGLDFAQQYRCLPYIGVLKPEVYSS